jgi:hypothetical protein
MTTQGFSFLTLWSSLLIFSLSSSCKSRNFNPKQGAPTSAASLSITKDFRLNHQPPIRNLSQLMSHFEASYPEQRGRSEPAVFIKSASVMLADYDLLRKDFSSLASLSLPQIDQWLVGQSAWMSQEQVLQGALAKVMQGGEFEVGGKMRTVYRPPLYNRALVLEAFEPDTTTITGLLDTKGSGSRAPHNRAGGHSNGLLSLGEGLREFAHEKLVNMIFRHARSNHTTVGIYAVLDLGFDIIDISGQLHRAGLVVRQSHLRTHESEHATRIPSDRDAGTGSFLNPFVVAGWNQEKILRAYGFSSSFRRQILDRQDQKSTVDVINIQLDTSRALIDIGTISFRAPFDSVDVFDLTDSIEEKIRPTEMLYFSSLPHLTFPKSFAEFSTSERFIAPRPAGSPMASVSRETAEKLVFGSIIEPTVAHLKSVEMPEGPEKNNTTSNETCQGRMRSCTLQAGFWCHAAESTKAKVTLKSQQAVNVCDSLFAGKKLSKEVAAERIFFLETTAQEKCSLTESELLKQVGTAGQPKCVAL